MTPTTGSHPIKFLTLIPPGLIELIALNLKQNLKKDMPRLGLNLDHQVNGICKDGANQNGAPAIPVAALCRCWKPGYPL
jgi:hypothetical protein